MRHNFVDQPMVLLRHESAGPPIKMLYETIAASLFARLQTPALLAARGFAYRARTLTAAHLCCVLLCVICQVLETKVISTFKRYSLYRNQESSSQRR